MQASIERRGFLAAAGATPLLLAAGRGGDEPEAVNARLRSVAEVRRLKGAVMYESCVDWSNGLFPEDRPDLEPLDPRELEREDEDERLGRVGLVAVGGDQVDDEWLRWLGAFDGLRQLLLLGARINGDGFRHLAGCARLHSIWLDRTPLDNGGLAQLAQLSTLRTIMIWRCTSITRAGIDSVKRLLPDARIVFHPTDGSPTVEW